VVVKTFNHMFTIAFEVSGSTTENGTDVTPALLRTALQKRIADLDRNGEWNEAVGSPDDTYEEGNPIRRA
jgi:hypothetical protein